MKNGTLGLQATTPVVPQQGSLGFVVASGLEDVGGLGSESMRCLWKMKKKKSKKAVKVMSWTECEEEECECCLDGGAKQCVTSTERQSERRGTVGGKKEQECLWGTARPSGSPRSLPPSRVCLLGSSFTDGHEMVRIYSSGAHGSEGYEDIIFFLFSFFSIFSPHFFRIQAYRLVLG